VYLQAEKVISALQALQTRKNYEPMRGAIALFSSFITNPQTSCVSSIPNLIDLVVEHLYREVRWLRRK